MNPPSGPPEADIFTPPEIIGGWPCKYCGHDPEKAKQQRETLLNSALIKELEALIKHPRVYEDLGNGLIIHYVDIHDIKDRIRQLKEQE